MTDDNLILTTYHNKVALVTLNKPTNLNALSDTLTQQLSRTLSQLERNDNVHVVVLTGSSKAFAAGADVKEMVDKSFPDLFNSNFITDSWEAVDKFPKPIIAAVSGYAFGGGCELALMCDFIIAAASAKFSQPEITIGITPGAGATQRLAKSIGKAKTMDMCLTANILSASDAEKAGFVSRVFPDEQLLEQTLSIARTISSFPLHTSIMIKKAVKFSLESTLSQGILYERQLFYSSFSFQDQKEGMNAFLQKRKPNFENT